MTVVTAKRAGWGERLTPEQGFDLAPAGEDRPPGDWDLTGELERFTVPAGPGRPAVVVTLVGGQEAEPATVRPLPDAEDELTGNLDNAKEQLMDAPPDMSPALENIVENWAPLPDGLEELLHNADQLRDERGRFTAAAGEAHGKTDEAARASAQAPRGYASQQAEAVHRNMRTVLDSGKKLSKDGHERMARAHDQIAKAHYDEMAKHENSGLYDSDFEGPGGSGMAPASAHEAAAYAHQNAAEAHRKAAAAYGPSRPTRNELSPELDLLSELVDNDNDWDPEKHPRGEDGRWTAGGGGSSVDVRGGTAGSHHGAHGEANVPKPDHGKVDGVPVTPPPPPSPGHKLYAPDVEDDRNGDGVTDAARVGVPAMSVPPPPSIGRLPNLSPHERAVEDAFIRHYERDPEGVAHSFRNAMVALSAKKGEPPTFGTDDAKVMAEPWTHPDPETRATNRATLNLALHQTANAITKRAFLQHLDTLKPGDHVMVTVGGCGAGKGYAISSKDKDGNPNVPQAAAIKAKAAAVWDSAGDQNATENPWIQKEAEKRGLKVDYMYVHADPKTQWAHPDRGVVKRAADPKDGRMVDAAVFADSYAIGARNHQAFYEANKDNPNASFTFIKNAGKPELLPGIPKEALAVDREELVRFAREAVRKADAPERVKAGATMGERLWKS